MIEGSVSANGVELSSYPFGAASVGEAPEREVHAAFIREVVKDEALWARFGL